jgi:hypothetical protein
MLVLGVMACVPEVDVVTVTVLAGATEAVKTGMTVRPRHYDLITATAEGSWSHCPEEGCTTNAAGDPNNGDHTFDCDWRSQTPCTDGLAPSGALIVATSTSDGTLVDDGWQVAWPQFTPPPSGELVLMMNDESGSYADNTGSLDVTLTRTYPTGTTGGGGGGGGGEDDCATFSDTTPYFGDGQLDAYCWDAGLQAACGNTEAQAIDCRNLVGMIDCCWSGGGDCPYCSGG